MRFISFLLVLNSLTIFPSIGYCQTKPLSIGDTMPDVTLHNIINFDTPSVKISDFKGKLLILDFWATWCSPCVAQLSKNDSLQKKFAGKVQFLSVSNEKQNVVSEFLKRLAALKHINIPSVVNDTILNSMFIHHYIPYYVWIDSDSKIIATTEENQVNEKNIKGVLAKNNSSIVNFIGQKAKTLNPKMPFFVIGIPLLNKGNDSTGYIEPVPDSSIVYQSILSKSIPGLPSKESWNSTHLVCSNAAILNLYQIYFGLHYKKSPLLFYSKSRYSIEVKDSLLFNKIITYSSGAKCLEWLKSNGYNYELVWRNAQTWDKKCELFKDDLERYFGKPLHISANIEKRLAPSDILTINDGGINLKTTGGTPYEKHDKFSYVQHNLPLSHFIDRLQSYFWQNSDRAIFDETAFKDNVDLDLNCKMNDEDAVNNELKKYGLKFDYGIDRLTDLMIIKDNQSVQKQ